MGDLRSGSVWSGDCRENIVMASATTAASNTPIHMFFLHGLPSSFRSFLSLTPLSASKCECANQNFIFFFAP